MNRDGWATACAIAAAIVSLLAPLATTTTLWDRDEARFAQAAVEMVQSGDYLLPTFNGELRPQKPPLVYWLTSASLTMLGQREIAVRIWSPLAMAIAAIATYAIGRRLWSPTVGHVAMVVLALTPLTVLEGVAATADAVLLAAITVSIAIAVCGSIRSSAAWQILALGVALGVGALAKGPVGVVLPVAIVASANALARPAVPLPRLLPVLALSSLLGIAIFACWFVPASIQSAGEIATRGLLRENLGRMLAPMDGHGTPLLLAPFYYPAVIALAFLPWTLYLPRALRRLIAARAWSAPREALLAAWIAVPLAIFTVSATKLPHYILPTWPALALAVSAALVAARGGAGPFHRAIPRTPVALTVGLVVALGIGVAPVLERYKPVPHVMAAVRRADLPGPIFTFRFNEPSLAFYGRRGLVEVADDVALWRWALTPGPGILVAPRAEIARVERRFGSLQLQELAAHHGWNYVKGERIELVAFVRADDR